MTKSPLSVTRALDDWIALNDEPREPDGKYHPSSFWTCLREAIYGLRGAEETNPTSAEGERTFWLGHIIHAGVQAALSVSADVAWFYPEFKVDIPELNITGHGDGLIGLADGRVIVLEAKSAKDSSFRRGLNEGHEKQASIYALAAHDYPVEVEDPETGEKKMVGPFGDSLIGILVFYLNKNESTTREHFLEWDPEWVTRIKDRVEEAEPYRQDPESLPPRLPVVKGKKPWKCNPKWCRFYDLCMSQPARGRAPRGVEEVAPW